MRRLLLIREMDSNIQEEIQEITSDNESDKLRERLGRTKMEIDGIGTDIDKTNTVVETKREPDEKEKNSTQNEIPDVLCGWRSVRSRGGFFYGFTEDIPRVRFYQVWPGKNVFFFRGRMICGPDPRGFILTMISVIIGEWIFFSYKSDVSHRTPAVVSVTSGVLSIIVCKVLINLFLVGTRDPGIIPRNQETQLTENGTSMHSKSTSKSRSRRIDVNGTEIKIKYCSICEIFRPPRSSHCAVCDNCVDRFDHHCPWIGQCIGLRNYRHYLMFVFSAFVFFLFIFAVSIWRIMVTMLATNKYTLGIIEQIPETFTLAIFSLMVVWFLGGLLIFHGYLISLNQTAHERFKQRYTNSNNPYDKGTRENIKEVLFAKLEPSNLNFRAVLKPEWNSIAKTLRYSAGRTRNEEVQTDMRKESFCDLNNDIEIEKMDV